MANPEFLDYGCGMADSELQTVDAVVEALGGNRAVAELVGGCGHTAVSNWRRCTERFPSRTFLAMTTELKRRGLRAPSSLWQMVEARAS